ncbi:VIT1/CCC1 transporter family protein [Corynebacterium pseudodiphtheriticum]|uniref:VIT1/CCC1 transporter family protein n=1 Tax=Corynebacterium pseudodiphtheriticum TaxID=37637 RepID=UPI00223BB204|nr:VIT1/CCC1 transporter family protein [Corynebacterium pseudodiphtheriticum]MCT1634978.1 VIT1/CCC1 transporter family protein [Corynebacterium pseudodiphtheriticum]MCT1666071.1 VIT1/CCC1 transporter family protein [Corynebacterium pseudodiphtheriticum]MDK4243973.1 VIT1/CCC1 transporter family protein [Corynebacterium pseudodiphtheriticum]WKS30673.1 VIT1/CCC1 transporter family protein [Corynebacterium pseudodiphtheriticum]WKS52242.1 VIT1/CCC1 transporter family protein [Corynebacterium pseud
MRPQQAGLQAQSVSAAAPSEEQLERWRRYLANERSEAAVYKTLAARQKNPEDREILSKIAEAESRHQRYWLDKLGDQLGTPRKADFNTRLLGFLAKVFGSVFTLALMQSAESRSPYLADEDASDQLAMDEKVHAEVVRGLATRSRERMSGTFRAAVFGVNDGLVSNLALVLGVLGSGVGSTVVLITGVSGLLAGALSMAAGEFISVRSQNELLGASTPQTSSSAMAANVDVEANELALVFRARGMSEAEAQYRADQLFARISHSAESYAESLSGGGHSPENPSPENPSTEVRGGEAAEDEEFAEAHTPGGAWEAAISSFCFFAGGALLPILPFIFGASTTLGAVIAVVLVSLALLITGAVTGILSGKPPAWRGLRQLLIGLGAAGITYLLGLAFGGVVG